MLPEFDYNQIFAKDELNVNISFTSYTPAISTLKNKVEMVHPFISLIARVYPHQKIKLKWRNSPWENSGHGYISCMFLIDNCGVSTLLPEFTITGHIFRRQQEGLLSIHI